MKRKLTGALLFLVVSLLESNHAGATILITEVMYNPPQGVGYEYVELYNGGSLPEDVGNWGFTEGIVFSFPAGSVIPAGAYVVVCRSKALFRTAYPSVPEASLFGDFTGSLANEGETLTLKNVMAVVQDSLPYDDDPPWEFLADGFGSSLERLCITASSALPENWRASPAPASAEEFGGSPGAANHATLCPPAPPVRPHVYVSEVMYHPVLEEAYEDEHEFVELHNADAAPVSIAGWRLAGAIDFVFPAGATIAAGGYAVIAKSKTKLAQVSSYGLNVNDIFGDYARTLDNGGEKVAVISAAGEGIDSMSYDDDFPWPIGCDALGAQDDYLKAAILPIANHRYRGYSLERVSYSAPSNEIANWVTSPLDGATPGRANASALSAPLPVVVELSARPAVGAATLIRSSQQVRIQVRFSPSAPAGAVKLEYFIDDVSSTSETKTEVFLVDDGTNGDLVADDGVFSATLPARPDNSIVRYRVKADRGSGLEVVSPRPTDPLDWHAYFVSPLINTQTRVYQVFISPANWGNMWRNIEGGRASGCTVLTQWDAKVPAVFVFDGKVTDVRVRYHGSRYNRWNGPDISTWPYPGPNYGPLRALSWRIGFPRYSQHEGTGVVILNKLTQSCPGYTSAVGFELFRMADLPAPQARYARLHINGGYYHYTMQYEHPDEEMMRNYHADQAARYPDRPAEEVGHLFKSAGCNCDEGPWGWGDERALNAACGFTKLQRYEYTYERRTYEWDGNEEVMDLIEDLNVARASLPNTAALRTFFEERFDLDLLLSYMAIINWSVPFDDMFQNHFLYQRWSDGKWMLTPWDLDLNFGGWLGAGSSLYMGEMNDPDNRSGWWNYLKDGFLKSYRSEYEERLLDLTNTILHPDIVSDLVDSVTAQANPTEAAQAPGGVACSFTGKASEFKNFATTRHTLVNQELSSVLANAGPDQTVMAGEVVQFDARASRPDPGAGVSYTWSNGMTGDYPTTVYDTPGTYVVTLTITVSGTPYRDSVKITVVPAPEDAFAEEGGQVVFEAEHYYANDPHGATLAWWEEETAQTGYSGTAYMEAKFTTYQKYQTDYAAVAPELKFTVRFQTPGSYRVWIRGLSSSQDADSCHVALDGAARDESYAQQFPLNGAFTWTNNTRGQGSQVLEVTTAGVHFLSIWIRESGQIIDKIILTTNTSYTPTGTGPAESDVVPIASHPTFIRGDANKDGVIDISDGVAILYFLFRGSSAMTCEDHGDFDDNGTLNVTDAISVLSYLFRSGASPSQPFPARGRDTTPDSYDCGD